MLKRRKTQGTSKIVKSKSKKQYFVYILRCCDKTLYCGSTSDLDKRLHAHNNLKSGAKYTSGRRPVFLVYTEKCKSFSKMRTREAEIKRMTKKEKEKLTKL